MLFIGAFMYQGHLNDGSSIQKHSAGGIYPCVLYVQEREGTRYWGIITPKNQHGTLFASYDDAVAYAIAWNLGA